MATEDIATALIRHISNVKQHYSLQEYNPLRAGGVADFFTVVSNTIELASAVKAAIDFQIPYVVMGEGSTLLFSDGGFPGLVIQNKSRAMAFDTEKSQAVVDSGVPLGQLITAAANQGLGGLAHLYGEPGTVGGAVYANVGPTTRPILSSLRFLTILLPPAKIDKEATIIRYKGEWMQSEEGLTKLHTLKARKPYSESQPVILTVLLQLTSVRTDEVRRQLNQQSVIKARETPRGIGMGPIFYAETDVTISELLLQAEPSNFKIGGVVYDKRHPNFLSSKGVVRSEEILQMIARLLRSVQDQTGVVLRCRYEYVVL
jgi:UDP-N-acetylmuramate dehydrogenase